MGTIVVGKVEAGHVKKGQQVVVMPNKVNFLEIVLPLK
jgi:translation elongation factor EF-1alpha